MKKGLNLLATLVIGAFLFGCAGVPKETVDALKKDIDEVGAKVTAAEPVLTAVADMEKEAGGKLSKKEASEFSTKIEDTKKLIDEIVALEAKIGGILDSLAVLDEKAKGKIKEDISTLNGEADALKLKIAKFKVAGVKVDELKAGLEVKEAVKPILTPKKAKPPKKKIK